MRRPLRIVSLLPSATEIICALGLEAELVGVTHECDFPAGVSRLPKVTHTLIPTDASSAEIDAIVRERLRDTRALYTLNLPVLKNLTPDLIVTQALCDVCAVAEAEVQAAVCQLPGRPRVVNLEPQTLTEVFDAIVRVAEAAGVTERADDVVAGLRARVDAVVARRVGRVFVTDGSQYFSRPGPRLVDSLEILAHAIDPVRHPLSDGLAAACLVQVSA